MKLFLNLKRQFASIVNDKEDSKDTNDSLIEIGLIVKKKREEMLLNRFDLAQKTRISPAVIEAIENNWIEKLPERAYLGSMVKILEKELKIPKNKLMIMLESKNSGTNSTIRQYVPNIDLFYTWRGSLVYLIFMFSTLFFLNYSHERFIQIDGVTLLGINHDPKEFKGNYLQEDTKINATKRKNKFNQIFNFFKLRKYKWVEIKTKNPVDIYIRSNSGQEMELNKAKGTIKIKLKSPITIRTNPSLNDNDSIIWAGKEFIPQEGNNGVYKF